MSERKVLNKYYPPDFDPSKIPRMKLAKNRQYTVRLMAPFNMRCATCGEYIYKGKKFNARKEDVENEDYLGIRIYRFYIKCTRCLQEISFKTDPKNTDYEIEAGATRNFMALKLAEEQAKREEDEQKEEEANNPMKLLEYRTEQSRQEIELLESLEELKELNRRQQAVDYEGMLKQYQPETADERKAREEKEDNEFIKSIKFGSSSTQKVVAEEIIEDVEDEPPAKTSRIEVLPPKTTDSKKKETWNRSIGVLTKKPALANLVKSKKVDTLNGSAEVNKKEDSGSVGVNSATSSVTSSTNSVTAPAASGLSLLANYSGSDSDQSE
ncbi:splicing factor YJU2 [Pectinophora gossypiella]|uniref:Splicing factor YJU2 n=1 Tax=Pectinophora gossypiella TaxID=13191 RepID=A0A1E1WQD6_PECGO|nr:splicing factor YJU2 [Pectinophora gossypiella]